ncbi:Tripartite tricarboxylate transporter family receptor [Bordetella pertussis]|nr:Tripartite tricarboxylate transporter family receptor [Bordetella pertussis]
MACAGTPDSSIGAMNKAINQALQKQELIDKLRRIGAQPMPGSQQDFARFIDAERKQWVPLAKSLGVRAD